MLSETELFDMKDLPVEMSSRLDQPWHFVGETVGAEFCMQTICERCAPIVSLMPPDSPYWSEPIRVVTMSAYRFITGDMLNVTIHFGACEKCDSVYWARQGPPFRRARAYVGV
jgi:hypothetical protein